MRLLDTLRNSILTPLILNDTTTLPALNEKDCAQIDIFINEENINTATRSIIIRRPIGYAFKQENSDEIKYRVLELRFTHRKDDKEFSASARRMIISQREDSNFAFTNSSLFLDTKFIDRLPVARYSKKKLVEFAEPYVDFINSRELIRWASEVADR